MKRDYQRKVRKADFTCLSLSKVSSRKCVYGIHTLCLIVSCFKFVILFLIDPSGLKFSIHIGTALANPMDSYLKISTILMSHIDF